MDTATVALSVISSIIGGIGTVTVYHIKFAQNIIERLARLETGFKVMCKEIEEIKNNMRTINGKVREHGEKLAKISN